MENINICKNGQQSFGHHHASSRRGPSSFHMQEPELVFNNLGLKPGDNFLDLGCGAGDYTMRAAEIIGETGMVFAFDALSGSINSLNLEIAERDIKNITANVADITKPLAVKDNSIDICMIATVLHSSSNFKSNGTLFSDIRRFLKPTGKLAIIECKKENMNFGPPITMRISAEELETIINGFGFKKTDYTDLGFNYMIRFEKSL